MFARTERLLLRPGWPEDANALSLAIGDETIVRNLGSAPWPYMLSDAEEFLDMPRPVIHPNFLIFRRTAGAPQLVGSIGFGEMENGGLELGYWISRQHWGLGYATEAGHAVLEIAKSLGHEQLQAEHFVDNPASGNVLRKLGFRTTGLINSRHSKGRGHKVKAIHFTMELGDSEPASDVMRPLAA
jgi:RimJ/RimL family protein N-acetyltransferase